MSVEEREMVDVRREAPAKAEPVSKRGVTAVYADELDGLRAEGPTVDVPADVRKKAREFTDTYMSDLTARVENYLDGLAAQSRRRTSPERGAGGQEIGEPTHFGYVYWDLITIAPIQFIGLPPYQPSKIIASGEAALLLAVLFINPASNIFNPISATTILGGRQFRVRFEQIDLSNVANGPDFTFTGTFPSPAPVISLFPVFFVAPSPGPNPQLIETNVTADITDLAQPFAAFATNHLDLDEDPGFLGIPPVPPQLQHDIPLRYLVYSK